MFLEDNKFLVHKVDADSYLFMDSKDTSGNAHLIGLDAMQKHMTILIGCNNLFTSLNTIM